MTLYNYRVTFIGIIVALIALFIAILALYFEYINLKVVLEELNSKSKIELKVRLGTSTISIGPEFTESVEITVVPRNIGNYNTSAWTAVIIFCSKTNVTEYDSDWKKIDRNMFVYNSRDKILSEKAVFSDELDLIGRFKVIFPGKSHLKDDQIIPIGLFTTYGEKSEQVNTFTYLNLNPKEGVKYESFLVNDGEVLTDIKGCFDVPQ